MWREFTESLTEALKNPATSLRVSIDVRPTKTEENEIESGERKQDSPNDSWGQLESFSNLYSASLQVSCLIPWGLYRNQAIFFWQNYSRSRSKLSNVY